MFDWRHWRQHMAYGSRWAASFEPYPALWLVRELVALRELVAGGAQRRAWHDVWGKVHEEACPRAPRPKASIPGMARKGERNGNAKLTEADVRRIRALRRHGATKKELVDRYGVSQRQIERIVDGTRWRHVPLE